MQWSDEGIVLTARKHGETSLIVTLLTREHGRHAGLVRGGAGRRSRGLYQPGNVVTADWQARLPEHLGTYRCEMVRAYAADLLSERLPLLALESAVSLLETTLPEREPHGALFAGLRRLVAALAEPRWQAGYVRWELDLLAELGFGLDLSACAATGVTEDLIFVSPRTGRAVSAGAGEPYRDRLLALPGFLVQDGEAPTAADIRAGLDMIGHFLERDIFPSLDRQVPPARQRLVDGLGRSSTLPTP